MAPSVLEAGPGPDCTLYFRSTRGRLGRGGTTASGALLEALTAVFEQGTFKAPKITRVIPLSEGRIAYEQVARGARGRLVLAP